MPRLLAVLATVALLSAACTSSGGSPAPSTSAGNGGSSSAAAAAQLAEKVQRGISGLTSAHLEVAAGALGGNLTGNVTFANGATTASDVTLDQGSGPIEVISAGGASYAKLPSSQNTSGKPWVRVSSTSSNEFVRAVAGTLSLIDAATSLNDLTKLLSTAASSVANHGSGQVNGVSAEHYTLSIDPTKATGALGAALSVAGTKALPVDLWIDGRGRPVQVKIAIPLGQQSLPLMVKVSNYNVPVHIAAPPANQVETS